jgi:predicted DNA-binding transcriptional regulator AlpA
VWRSTKRYPELEYVKIGRNVRYRRSAIERFIQLRTVSA